MRCFDLRSAILGGLSWAVLLAGAAPASAWQTSAYGVPPAGSPLAPAQTWTAPASAPYGQPATAGPPNAPGMAPVTISDQPAYLQPDMSQSAFGQPSLLAPPPPLSIPGAQPCVPECPPCGTAPGLFCATPDDLFANFYDPFSTQFTYGQAGAQRYEYGWLSYNDFTYIPSSPADGVPGSMQILEWNSWVRYSKRLGDNLLFVWTPEFNGEFWRPPATLGLPTYVNEFKSDFKLASVNPGPWNWQVGFTPQLNADLKRSLDANAYVFDGRAVALYKASPKWTFAGGFEYWERVRNYVIPYGGVIYTPNNRWEFRMLFPSSRISYYLGNAHTFDLWAYCSANYLIEAYQIDTAAGIKERGQWKDYEVLFGIDGAKGKFSMFLQAGAVFDRQVRFSGPTPGFSLGNQFIVRTGFIF